MDDTFYTQTTASEATFISLMAGRTEAIRTNKAAHPNLNASEINARLVAYCSDQVSVLTYSSNKTTIHTDLISITENLAFIEI